MVSDCHVANQHPFSCDRSRKRLLRNAHKRCKQDEEEVEVTVSSAAAEDINTAAAEIDLIFTSKTDTESFSQPKRCFLLSSQLASVDLNTSSVALHTDKKP